MQVKVMPYSVHYSIAVIICNSNFPVLGLIQMSSPKAVPF